jgi:hypothetical protein
LLGAALGCIGLTAFAICLAIVLIPAAGFFLGDLGRFLPDDGTPGTRILIEPAIPLPPGDDETEPDLLLLNVEVGHSTSTRYA